MMSPQCDHLESWAWCHICGKIHPLHTPPPDILSPTDALIVDIFIINTFDPRLKIAKDDKYFSQLCHEQQKQTLYFLLTHYSKVVYKLMPDTPAFDITYPAIISRMFEKSRYYKEMTQ